jgi:hypothetical protein
LTPPLRHGACLQFYTGWLTHWGEQMANTSSEQAAGALRSLLAFAGRTASVNLYMAHGGTNFGFWAGALGRSRRARPRPRPPSLRRRGSGAASTATCARPSARRACQQQGL